MKEHTDYSDEFLYLGTPHMTRRRRSAEDKEKGSDGTGPFSAFRRTRGRMADRVVRYRLVKTSLRRAATTSPLPATISSTP